MRTECAGSSALSEWCDEIGLAMMATDRAVEALLASDPGFGLPRAGERAEWLSSRQSESGWGTGTYFRRRSHQWASRHSLVPGI